MFVSEYIKNLLKKAGVNPEDDKFKEFFLNEGLTKLEVPADIATGIDNNLISITAAKDNYGPLKNHYTALALNGIDTNIDQLLEELGLGDDDKTELKLEKSTGKRVAALIKKVQAAEAKKANADKPDKAAIQKTIDGLNQQIVAEKALATQAVENAKKEIKQMRLEYAVGAMLGNHKTIYDGTLSPDVKGMTLQNVIKSKLQLKGAKLEIDDSGNVIILRTDGTNYFGENHQPVTPAQFIEQSLSSEKLLAVNNPANPSNGQPPANPNNGQPQIINTSGDGKKVVGQNPIFQELMANAKKDFNNVNGTLVPTT